MTHPSAAVQTIFTTAYLIYGNEQELCFLGAIAWRWGRQILVQQDHDALKDLQTCSERHV